MIEKMMLAIKGSLLPFKVYFSDLKGIFLPLMDGVPRRVE
jgi:hypothetical protein